MKAKYSDMYLQLGLKIAYYRKLRGLTQEQLAEKLDKSPAFIGHVEAPNINKAVSLDTLLTSRRFWTFRSINFFSSTESYPHSTSPAGARAFFQKTSPRQAMDSAFMRPFYADFSLR